MGSFRRFTWNSEKTQITLTKKLNSKLTPYSKKSGAERKNRTKITHTKNQNSHRTQKKWCRKKIDQYHSHQKSKLTPYSKKSKDHSHLSSQRKEIKASHMDLKVIGFSQQKLYSLTQSFCIKLTLEGSY